MTVHPSTAHRLAPQIDTGTVYADIVGMLSRLVAIPSIVHLTLAIVLWDIREGFAPVEGGGAQLPLLLIAGFVVVLLAGPGPVSLDSVLGWDNGWEGRPRTADDRARVA